MTDAAQTITITIKDVKVDDVVESFSVMETMLQPGDKLWAWVNVMRSAIRAAQADKSEVEVRLR